MTIEVISFLIGAILIGTAVVGGGFEIREIKMPHVGAGVRIVSLVVGSGFLMLGLGMWSINNPQIQANQASMNALMSGTQAAAQTGTQAPAQAETQPRAATPVDVKTEAAAPAQEQVVWDQPAQPAFTGFNGNAYISWTIDGASYYGLAKFFGSTGILRLTFSDPASQVELQVDQDLSLQSHDGAFWYMGSNPREASSQTPLDVSEYLPDNFRVVAGSQGWTMDQTCSNGACYPLSVQSQ